jgi:hypothetical protein
MKTEKGALNFCRKPARFWIFIVAMEKSAFTFPALFNLLSFLFGLILPTFYLPVDGVMIDHLSPFQLIQISSIVLVAIL